MWEVKAPEFQIFAKSHHQCATHLLHALKSHPFLPSVPPSVSHFIAAGSRRAIIKHTFRQEKERI